METRITIKQKVLSSFKGKEQQIFRPHEIIDLVLQKYPGTNRTSILPADYCYNRINKGIKFNFHVFESLPDGTYKFLGLNYPFTGPVLWKGEQVGTMKNGRYTSGKPII
jgi:hypothetical protein